MSNKKPLFNFENSYRQQLDGCYLPWQPRKVNCPKLIFWNDRLAHELGIDRHDYSDDDLAKMLAENDNLKGAEPIAQAYAGHQFGHFSPQLGDGRALLLGEFLTTEGQRWDLALKGSGATPFSRGADGKAAVGPMLREVLMSEALHQLGVPTTRSLAVIGTGEMVQREQELPGAILVRVAASHLRIGTVQFFAARGDFDRVQKIVDYAIKRHDLADTRTPHRYSLFLMEVAQRQARLIASWMGLGFIHGVMNTDNITLSGETIDFGPCAFMEQFHEKSVFSSIDHHGRYAYGNQPIVAKWNIARLAEAILPLLAADRDEALTLAEQAVAHFDRCYEESWLLIMRSKLGIVSTPLVDTASDVALIQDLLGILSRGKIDFTLAFSALTKAWFGDEIELNHLLTDDPHALNWLDKWHKRIALLDPEQRSIATIAIKKANPPFIPRNQLVEEALKRADRDDLSLFHQILAGVQNLDHDEAISQDLRTPSSLQFMRSFLTYCGT